MKYRPCFVCAVTALAAVGLCVFLHNQIAWILTAAGITLAAVFLFIFQKGVDQRIAAILCMLTCVGCILRFGTAFQTQYEYAVRQVGSMRELRGYVAERLADNSHGHPRYLLQMYSFDREKVEHPVQLIVTVETNLRPEIGDRLYYYSEVTRKYDDVVEDTTAKMLGSGVFLTSYITDESMAVITGKAEMTLSLRLQQQREKLCALADVMFEQKEAQIFKGMLYGDKRNMEENILIDFRYSGFVHLLAVSGLHIQVIFGMVLAVFRRLLFWLKPRKQVAGITSVILIWGFILLIGCPISAVRSGIMVTVSTLGVLIGHRSETLNSLGISVLIIQLLMPFSVCDIGFWLSVLATFGIGSFGTYFYRVLHQLTGDHLDRYRSKLNALTSEQVSADVKNADAIRSAMLKKRQKHAKQINSLGKAIRAFVPGVSASIGMMPFYLFYFGYLPLGSVLLGPFLGILFSAIAGLGVLFTVSGVLSFSFGITASAWTLQPLLRILGSIVAWVADVPLFVVPLRKEFAILFCLITVIILILCQKDICKRLFGVTKRLKMVIFLLSFYVLGLLFTLYYQYNIVEVAAVGGYSGKDIIVTANNKATVFISCGGYYDEQALYSYLRKHGICEIEAIYLLTPYNGITPGMEFLSEQMPIGKQYYNTYGLPGKYNMTPIKPGDTFITPEIVATFTYIDQSLNVAIQHGTTKLCIVSVAESDKLVQIEGSDVVFVYDATRKKDAMDIYVDCMVVTQSIGYPNNLLCGRFIPFSTDTTVIEFDLQGEIHLP